MNNNDVSTLQSLQNRKLLLQITQKLNANLIESIFIKTLFQRYRIEFCSKKKEIETNAHAHWVTHVKSRGCLKFRRYTD